jgi:hypothetical protein
MISSATEGNQTLRSCGGRCVPQFHAKKITRTSRVGVWGLGEKVTCFSVPSPESSGNIPTRARPSDAQFTCLLRPEFWKLKPQKFPRKRKIRHRPPFWGTHLGLGHFRSSGVVHIWHLDSARPAVKCFKLHVDTLTVGEISVFEIKLIF